MVKRVLAVICVLAACGILVSLGVWQLHRLQWKLDLISRIAAQTNVNASAVSLQTQLDDPENRFNRGFLQGRYLQGHDVRVGPRMTGEDLGYWVVSPLKLFGGRIVLINRGWVKEGAAIPAPPTGMMFITGTLRESDKADVPVAGNAAYWHQIDIAGIAKAQALKTDNVALMMLFAETSKPADNKTLSPVPVATQLRNDHLQYAIFWFTMAGILFLSFLFFSFRGRR
jgi:surfeit locus 1 family protein